MKKSILGLAPIFLALVFFSGCSKYYATSSQEHQVFRAEKQVPVKVELTQTDWSIVVNLPEKDIKKNVTDVLFDNPIFREDNNSSKILKVDITHTNDHGGAEMANAMLTGASLYLIPGVADSDVNINVSIGEISSNYKGELIVAQGLGANSIVDKTKYTEDTPLNLMKDLIRNAIDTFTLVYLENSDKLEK